VVHIDEKKNRLNNDTIPADSGIMKMRVNNIYLEDLIKYQEIEFEVVKGYCYAGKRAYEETIQTFIKKLFAERLKCKREKTC
jgi:hypothetical protein